MTLNSNFWLPDVTSVPLSANSNIHRIATQVLFPIPHYEINGLKVRPLWTIRQTLTESAITPSVRCYNKLPQPFNSTQRISFHASLCNFTKFVSVRKTIVNTTNIIRGLMENDLLQQ